MDEFDFEKGGIFENISEDIYFDLNCFSNSRGCRILDVPAATQVPWPETDALRFGKAFHSAILEPEKFEELYIEPPPFDKRTKIGKAGYHEFMIENADKEFLRNGEILQIEAMKASIMSHPLMPKIFEKGTAETSVFWRDKITEIDCKCRIDWIPAAYKMLVDVKTAKDASHDGFKRAIKDRKYYMQAAVYLSAWNMFVPEELKVDMFVFIPVEKTPPYRFNLFYMDFRGRYVQKGLEHWGMALEEEKKCRQLQHYKSFNVADDEIFELEPPSWF